MPSAWPQSVIIKMSFVQCCWAECGVMFGMPQTFEEQRRKDHKGFHCPNGHIQFYLGETEAEKLKKQLADSEKLRERAVKEKEWAQQQTKLAETDAKVARRHAKRAVTISRQLRQRVKAGTCPCCDAHFENLAVHMKAEHPKYR